LKTIPASVDDYLRSVPQLAGVAHPWLGQFVLVNFGLEPVLLFSIEDKDVVDNSLLSVTFATAKDKKKLAELC